MIHNFVNVDTYRPNPARNNREKILLHISNFRPVKTSARLYPDSAQGAAAPASSFVDGRRWSERGPAEALARDLGEAKHVTFLGKQDHVERLIPNADVLLLPSELEAFGLAALEGMACGVPPVATDAGGLPELVTHGVDGFLEAVGDTEAQAARVIELLTDGSLSERMSAAARLSAETPVRDLTDHPPLRGVLLGSLRPLGVSTNDRSLWSRLCPDTARVRKRYGVIQYRSHAADIWFAGYAGRGVAAAGSRRSPRGRSGARRYHARQVDDDVWLRQADVWGVEWHARSTRSRRCWFCGPAIRG